MDRRHSIILPLLSEYVSSPSLRHLRDQRALAKLSFEITAALDRDGAVWRKWEGPRDIVLSSALDCWIPKTDLLAFLNSLPGPHLTMTDLEQRMRHLIEVEYIASPEPKLKDECLEIYQAEIAAGTEMPAIVGRISDYVGDQWQRLWEEQRAEKAQRLEGARQKREQRLLSYADCPWTQIRGSKFFYCRKNGRVFQLKPNNDKSWNMYRVPSVDDTAQGVMIGRYRSRADANTVLAKAAFEADLWP